MTGIPKIESPEVCEIIMPSGSKFVELSDGADFDVKMQYDILGMENAVKKVFCEGRSI